MLPFPSQGIFPTQGSSLCLQLSRQILYHWATWEAHVSELLFSHSVMSDYLRPHGLQHARLPCPSILPRVAQTHGHWVEMPSNCLFLCHPLLLLPSIFPSIRVFSRVHSSHQVATVLEFQLQHQSFQQIFRVDCLEDGLVGPLRSLWSLRLELSNLNMLPRPCTFIYFFFILLCLISRKR